MRTLYNNNLYMKLYSALWHTLDCIHNASSYAMHEWKPIDPLLRLILLNNGCSYDTNNQSICDEWAIIKNKYYLLFIRHWKGNEVNEYFDVVEFYGVYYLIIFTDYFDGIKKTFPADDDMSIEAIADRNMGNSSYYDAICKIVKIYTALVFNPAVNMPAFSTTAVSMNARIIPSIIAIKILNSFRPVTQNDVPDIPEDEIQKYIDMPIDYLVNGIRQLDDEEG